MTGKWYEKGDRLYCSNCHSQAFSYEVFVANCLIREQYISLYCPICGCRMIEHDEVEYEPHTYLTIRKSDIIDRCKKVKSLYSKDWKKKKISGFYEYN